ncbi:uncharacterized protein LOC125244109 [Megalobrama amblycephala]|uniref:uncharacterized protein LOC125244109 n=1 Tax=Megalobrama amblycephala TaxID=75352 RepID=UPI00201455B6|nr:uncharacterized protein LOC125244109 [Megalobrama amblycephala]XP_048010039.1 uncharacterized protein LOC125244109 [Megalobrama amblycephala]
MQTPAPFEEIITSLMVMQQDQHQALLELCQDQERRFQAVLQAQQEDRERFRSWMDREVRPGVMDQRVVPTHIPLHKMGPEDDPEVFLDLFERSAEVCGWPRGQWPMRLVPRPEDLKRAFTQQVTLRCGDDHRPSGTGAVHHSAAQKNSRVGPVPPPHVAGVGYSSRGGPHGGVPWGRRTSPICFSLSLPSPSLSLGLSLYPGPIHPALLASRPRSLCSPGGRDCRRPGCTPLLFLRSLHASFVCKKIIFHLAEASQIRQIPRLQNISKHV